MLDQTRSRQERGADAAGETVIKSVDDSTQTLPERSLRTDPPRLEIQEWRTRHPFYWEIKGRRGVGWGGGSLYWRRAWIGCGLCRPGRLLRAAVPATDGPVWPLRYW